MRVIFKDNVRYAVQVGSHSAVRGWNNANRGVLIYFDCVQDISYDAVKHTATLQPVILGERRISPCAHGVTVMCGRFGHWNRAPAQWRSSYISPAHGLSSDAYVELGIVLVDGTLVTATAENEYSDLFRALKGGANRFGIVTRYEVTVFDVGSPGEKQWDGRVIAYSGYAIPALLKASAKIQRVPSITSIHHGSSLPPEVFGDFLAIPSVFQQIGPLNYSEVSSVLGPGADRGAGNLLEPQPLPHLKTSPNTPTHTHTFKTSPKPLLAFTPIQESQIPSGRARGGNVMDPHLGAYGALQLQTTRVPGVTSIFSQLEAGRKNFFDQ